MAPDYGQSTPALGSDSADAPPLLGSPVLYHRSPNNVDDIEEQNRQIANMKHEHMIWSMGCRLLSCWPNRFSKELSSEGLKHKQGTA